MPFVLLCFTSECFIFNYVVFYVIHISYKSILYILLNHMFVMPFTVLQCVNKDIIIIII